MITLINIELYKIFKRGRTYIGFIAVFVIVFAMQVGVYYEGQNTLDFVFQNLQESFTFQGNLINGYLTTFLILNTLWIHIPILIALVAGDLLAGEANAGTFRLILTRPISRTKLLIAKFFAGWIYSVSLVTFMGIISLIPGLLFFGSGDLIVMKTTINVFAAEDLMWRFLLAFAYGMVTMTTIAALAFMLSAFSDNSVGPIVGTFAIIVALTIISTVGESLLRPILPYLFTTYLPSWLLFFEFEPNAGKIMQAVIVELIYTLVFLLVTLIYFRRKDILS